MIAGLLLAAGSSSRFGADKLAVSLQGRPILAWSAAALLASVDAVYVVLPPNVASRRAALGALPVSIIEHDGREGLASSLRAGVAALPDEVGAVVLALADQPLVAPSVVARLVDRWRVGDVQAAAPTYRDGRGHPVLIGRPLFDRVLLLRGDVGARSILDGLGDALALVPVDDDMPADVDTPEMLHALERTSRRDS